MQFKLKLYDAKKLSTVMLEYVNLPSSIVQIVWTGGILFKRNWIHLKISLTFINISHQNLS